MINNKILRKFRNKKGVSLIISYVLLVTIAIIMSIIVFSYLKVISNVEPVIDCNPGTSIVVEDYICGGDKISLVLRNNGRFNVDGFIPSFGGDSDREPITKLIFNSQLTLLDIDETITNSPPMDPPRFFNTLEPGETVTVEFTNKELKPNGEKEPVNFEFVRNLRVQAYTIDKDTRLQIPCGDSISTQNVEDCRIKDSFLVFEPKVHYELEGTFLDTKGNADIDRSQPSNKEKYSEGYLGQGIDFDGSYYLLIRNTNPQGINNDLSNEEITIAFWLKKENENSTLIRKGTGNGFKIDVNDSRISARIANSNPISICENILPDQWTHVTITGKKGGDQIIYINGNQCVIGSTGPAGIRAAPSKVFIGVNLIGKMDEIKIWDLELNEGQVASLYSSYIN